MSEAKRRAQPPRQMQNVFVFLLLAIFAVSAIFLTALCAQVYRNTVQSANADNASRVLSAIIRGAAQGEDAGQVYVTEERVGEAGAVPVLVFANDYDGEIYLRRLYCLDGWLRESFTAEEYGFQEEMGEPLVEAASFTPEVEGSLLRAGIVTPAGQREDVSVYLWAGGAKE